VTVRPIVYLLKSVYTGKGSLTLIPREPRDGKWENKSGVGR
jgi:hypothetical protein